MVTGRTRRTLSRALVAVGAAATLALLAPGGTAAASTPVPAADGVARGTWEATGRPAKMIIVRATAVESVLGGELTRRVPRPPGTATPGELSRSVPDGWITAPVTGTTRISAAVVLDPGVLLELGRDARVVELTGGAGAADAAWIRTGGGRLTVHDTTITSVDPVTGRPQPPGPGRPFVAVDGGGRLYAADATFSDLGRPAEGAPGGAEEQPGVEFAAGSGGAVARTALLRNSTGLRLNGSAGVHLDGVRVAESAADGLVLRGDQGTTLRDVRADRNGGSGVVVSGPSTPRPITGITTTGNREYGLTVLDQAAPQITDVVTQADGVGGLHLSGGADATVTGFAAVDEPIGVRTHLGATRVTLKDLRVVGGDRGVEIDTTTTGLTMTGSTVTGTATGISVGGSDVDLHDIAIGGSRSGVRVERGAARVTGTRLTVTDGQDGVVAGAGTTGVVLRDLTTERMAGSGVRTASPDTHIIDARITGGAAGIAADAATTITGTEITEVQVGIRSRSTAPVAATAIRVSATESGIVAEDGALLLTDSAVEAGTAVTGAVQLVGHNELSRPPLNTVSLVGIPLVLLALVLDQVQRLRHRRRPDPAPARVGQGVAYGSSSASAPSSMSVPTVRSCSGSPR